MQQRVMVLMLCAAVFACGCRGGGDNGLRLKDMDRVYVALDPATMASLNEALAAKGYGNVRASDMKMVFTYADARFRDGRGPAVAVFTAPGKMAYQTIYTEMRVWQCYEAVLADAKAKGICVNPLSRHGESFTVSRAEMAEALPQLPRPERLPVRISVMQ